MLAAFAATVFLSASHVFGAEPFWQEVSSSPEAVLEVDAANIRVREHMLTAWVRLTTSHSAGPEKEKFRSAVMLTAFDCEAEKSGVSSTTTFSEPRGDGKTVHIDEGLPVSIVSLSYQRPGTPGYDVLKFVCEFTEQRSSGGTDAAMRRLTDAEEAAKARREAAETSKPLSISAPVRVTRAVSPDDYYPAGSIRRGEQGSAVVKVCVGPAGQLLREPQVTDTSGFPELDAAAIKVAKANRYEAGRENGALAAESCLKFKVAFSQGNR